MKVSISEASRILGVSTDTLRRWDKAGTFQCERTAGGHRRYDLDKLSVTAVNRPMDSSRRITIGYARVSSHDQKEDLKRQAALLSEFCVRQGWTHEIIEDIGNGLNYDKKGLHLLIKRIVSGKVDRLVLTRRDRLLRFGSELVFALCEHFGAEVVMINHSEDFTCEEDLVQDVLEIINVFSVRLYDSRSYKNKVLVKALKEVADKVGQKNPAELDAGLREGGHSR